jgi:LysR family nitrogen assimilation transcriptional regulator
MHPRISIGLLQRSAIELPNVQIQVQEAVTATLIEWVRTERVDIALVYLAGNRPKDVMIEDLAHESAVFVQCSTGAPKPPTISLAEVCQHTLVMPGHPHHLRELLQASAEQEGLEAEVSYEIGAVSTILEMVERNIACAVLPAGAVARSVSDGRLLARKIVAPELRVTLSLVRSSHRALSKAQVLLRRLLADLAIEDGLHPAPLT